MTPERPDLSRVLTLLCGLIFLLALASAAAGLLTRGGEGPYTHTSARGEEVEIYGRGLYEHDSTFKAAGNRGTDALTLLIGLPLLAGTAILSSRGSLRARLLLLGALAYVLYVYATLSLATAYNDLFLVYVALFGASLFAAVLLFTSIDRQALRARFSSALPRRFPGVFLIVSGVITLFIWLMDPVFALLEGEPPELLDGGTTLVTHALDMAIIVPVVTLAGVLILRGEALGYVLAVPLLVIEAMLAPMIVLQTIFQLEADVTFTTGEIVGPIGGFLVLAAIALWVLYDVLRNVADEPRLAAI
jgi:hypothetical protein